MMAPMERLMIGRWRRRLLREVRGPRVLELAIGTGLNLPYYPPGIELTGIDTSRKMMAHAAERAQQLGIPLELRPMDVQQLEFPDQSFDTVVATFLFCSVEDPLAGLREMRRVCKPEGRILLMEHVRPPGLLGRLADRWNAWTYEHMGHENINRRTAELLPAAGIRVIRIEKRLGGVVKLMVGTRE